MTDSSSRIADAVARIRERIAAAAQASGRSTADVKLVAVTKYVGSAEVDAVIKAGCRDLGESRPQDLWEKAAHVERADVAWHLVGHLQRNKVRRTIPLVALIHSVDSLRLVRAIDEAAAALATRCPILIEVNISTDEAKHGFAPDAIEPALPELAEFAHVEVRGLMTMAALEGGLDGARKNFANLRELRDRLRSACPAEVTLDELSMGMSRDYEAAIEEGATIVRVGRALFE